MRQKSKKTEYDESLVAHKAKTSSASQPLQYVRLFAALSRQASQNFRDNLIWLSHSPIVCCGRLGPRSRSASAMGCSCRVRNPQAIADQDPFGPR